MKICLKCGSAVDDSWNCRSCGWQPQVEKGFLMFAKEIVEGTISFPSKDHDYLAKLEETNFWFVSRNCLLCYLLKKYFQDAENVLEIGCGNGFVLSGLLECSPHLAVSGSEAYLSGLLHTRKRLPNAWLAQMDARQIPFESEFDVIGAFDVLEHIDEDREVLIQMYNALNPGGGIILTVPQHQWLWSDIDETAGHKRRYTRHELVEKIESAGFVELTATSYFTFLLPAMVLSRLSQKSTRFPAEKKGNTGLKLHPIINTIFSKVCDIERVIIQAGVSMPWGGSLVCTARKPKL